MNFFKKTLKDLYLILLLLTNFCLLNALKGKCGFNEINKKLI